MQVTFPSRNFFYRVCISIDRRNYNHSWYPTITSDFSLPSLISILFAVSIWNCLSRLLLYFVHEKTSNRELSYLIELTSWSIINYVQYCTNNLWSLIDPVEKETPKQLILLGPDLIYFLFPLCDFSSSLNVRLLPTARVIKRLSPVETYGDPSSYTQTNILHCK